MAKLTDYTNPISGSKGNLFDLKGLWSMVLGVFVFLFVFAMGEKLAGRVSGKAPYIATSPTNPFSAPQAVVATSQKRIV